MKKLFTCLLVVGCMGMGHAQSKDAKPRLSAGTLQYLNAYKSAANTGKPIQGYVYKTINNRHYISAFIKVYNDMDQSKLDALGVYIGTKAGNIWTAQIPVENVEAFTQVMGIDCIDLDAPIKPLLDAARKYTKADSAQLGGHLPFGISGKNVVVGIVDAGFDFTHPTLYDTGFGECRIKRVWLQKGGGGTPPSGFAYGVELTDTNAIKTRGSDTAILSHGTHVAGIAAGSGNGSNAANTLYRGMAYESDIVMVGIMPAPAEWAVAGESDIIDGMHYIYTYAASVSKPAVVNLSWGSTIGPHDGNSLFSQACDGLTGAGKIFVCAAGNNGMDTVHLGKSFTASDTTVSTFVTFSPYLDTAHQDTWVDAWGDTGKSFCMNFKLYNGATAIDSTPFVCTSGSTSTTSNFHLIGSNHDTCFITVTMVDTEYNGKPHAIVYYYSRVHDNICMTTKAVTGTVHMWEGYLIPPEGYYGYMKSLGYAWAVNGDTRYTVSDIGCTRSAITVGAFTTKLSFHSILGATYGYSTAHDTVFHIASFSSVGPTVDNRVKPDITAPGFALASSVNSFDTSYLSGHTNYASITTAATVGSKTYDYAMLAGTSMASPCAAGIVGMMLQLDPTLTPDSAKIIINATAMVDAYTHTIPAGGSLVWGNGKINAYMALRYIAGTLTMVNTLAADPMDCILYPNPNKGSFTIDYNSKTAEQLTVAVYDITGKLVSMDSWYVSSGRNSKSFSSAGLAKGVYFTRVSSLKGNNVIKMVVE